MYKIFVVDQLHEIKLGVWKSVLTHLIRILHALRDGGAVTPLGLSCWHVSLLYLYSALYDSCELIMCTTGSLNAHTGHFRNLDT